MICPSVPEAAITPVATVGGYPCRSIGGRLMRPMVMTVAPTIPVEAASSAPTMTTETAIPPRTDPKRLAMLLSIRSASPLFSSMMPIKTKSGTASSTELSITPMTRLGRRVSTAGSRKQKA